MRKGQSLPHNVGPMPLLTDAELAAYPEPTTADVVPGYVARYLDMMALADKQPASVIGPNAMLTDRPGFDVEFLTHGSISESPAATDSHTILMPVKGHWRLTWDGGTTALNPGDTAAIPPNLAHALEPAMTGEASTYRVTSTDDPAGATWRG